MKLFGTLRLDNRAAVAPTVALALTALIGVGGLAFDYAHMAALDTELQNAADQAALAAATQLDGATNARARATAAANSLLRNTTLFANQSGGPSGDTQRIAVTVAYYQSYTESSDVPGSGATSDADAKVAIVTIGARKASFALTPVLKVFDSGPLSAQAVASLTSSICQVPPLMFCAPNPDFPQSTDIGKGVLLEPGGGGAWTAGNYGYLDFGNGASGVKTNLGKNNDGASCIDNTAGTSTEPGNQASVTNFLNTRFDLYAPSVTACNAATGDYCPAENVRKDMYKLETFEINGTSGTIPPRPVCGATVDLKSTADFTQSSTVPELPRDTVHNSCAVNSNSCNKIGDGVWGRDAYIAAVLPGYTTATLATAVGKTPTTLTRWDVYQFELADKANRMQATLINTSDPATFKATGNSGSGKWTWVNQCAYPFPKNGIGVASSGSQKDRRLLTVAVVDCTGASGKFDAKVLRFADMLLTQPSLDRGSTTGKDQIYTEIVRVSQKPSGQSAFQFYLRQRARLLK